jgi:hypothetical protein
MVQIDDREIVKEKYEIGLSQFLLKRGFQIKCWIDLQQKNPYLEKTNVNTPFNPSQHGWFELWQELGIIKIELLKTNPFNLDLSNLIESASNNATLKSYLVEALKN